MSYWSLFNSRRSNIETFDENYYRQFENNSVERNNWIAKTLAQIPSGLRILDAGAGEQQYRSFCAHLQYVAHDFAQYDGMGDNKGLQQGSWDRSRLDIISDITNIPEPDSSFDVVMCTEVFEHLPNPLEALIEFSRLLRKGGHLIITAPFCSLSHMTPYHFYSGFNRYFYEKHLSEKGFDILELKKNGNYFKYLAQEIHRVPSIAKMYTGYGPRWIEFIAMYIILEMFKRFDLGDKESSDILNFGYHVHAIKR